MECSFDQGDIKSFVSISILWLKYKNDWILKAAGNSSVLQEVPTNDLFNPEEKGSKALNWLLFNLPVLRCPEDFLTATHEELPTNQNSYYAQRTPQEDRL